MSAFVALVLASALLALPPHSAAATRAERLQQVNASSGLLARLRALLPNTPIVRVTRTEVPGLWRVELGEGKVAYTDGSGRYLVLGLVIDLHTGRALDDALSGTASNTPTSEE